MFPCRQLCISCHLDNCFTVYSVTTLLLPSTTVHDLFFGLQLVMASPRLTCGRLQNLTLHLQPAWLHYRHTGRAAGLWHMRRHGHGLFSYSAVCWLCSLSLQLTSQLCSLLKSGLTSHFSMIIKVLTAFLSGAEYTQDKENSCADIKRIQNKVHWRQHDV